LGTVLIAISIPASVQFIRAACFGGCRTLRTFIFEEGPTVVPLHLDDLVFSGCKILQLTIPARAVALTGETLVGVKSFSLAPGSEHFSIQADGSLYDISGGTLIRGLLHRVHVMDNVQVIGRACFSGRPLQQITFGVGSQLKSIEEDAFRRTELVSVRFPASVESLETRCFFSAHLLRDVTFEPNSSLRSIGKEAFAFSHLVSIEIPASVEIIRKGCFYHCSRLRKVKFEAGSRLHSIKRNAFVEMEDLTFIQIPASVQYIADGCFFGLERSRITIEFEKGSPLAKQYEGEGRLRLFLNDFQANGPLRLIA
jgi:hypothetical protein